MACGQAPRLPPSAVSAHSITRQRLCPRRLRHRSHATDASERAHHEEAIRGGPVWRHKRRPNQRRDRHNPPDRKQKKKKKKTTVCRRASPFLVSWAPSSQHSLPPSLPPSTVRHGWRTALSGPAHGQDLQSPRGESELLLRGRTCWDAGYAATFRRRALTRPAGEGGGGERSNARLPLVLSAQTRALLRNPHQPEELRTWRRVTAAFLGSRALSFFFLPLRLSVRTLHGLDVEKR